MIRTVIQNRTFTAVLLILVNLVFCAPSAWAELRYSYTPELNDSQILANASVKASEIWVFDPAASTGSTLDCCDWSTGPGSRFEGQTDSYVMPANQSVKIDLRDYAVGSERTLSFSGGTGNGSLTFAVTVGDGFVKPVLAQSGPVQASSDGAVIENLRISTSQGDSCAVRVENRNDVVVRNIEIAHHGNGICVINSNNIRIENVNIVSVSAPEAGPHCSFGVGNCYAETKTSSWADPFTRLNIFITDSDNVSVEFAYLEKGSSGIYLKSSDDSKLYDIQCQDARGPKPMGNCVLWDESDNGQLKNFSVQNFKNISHVEDNVNLYNSDNGSVSHGFIDGNYSIFGVGVIADFGSDNLNISNVDVSRVGVAAINVWSGGDNSTIGQNFTARNIRVRDTVCEGRHGTTPSSNGIAIAVHPAANNPKITDTIYWNHCRPDAPTYCTSSYCRTGSGGEFDIKEQEFQMKDPLKLIFDWQRDETPIQPVSSTPRIISIEVQ